MRDEADLGWFYDKDGGAIIEDTAALTAYLKERFPQKPLTLFGHSMGSMVARVYLQKYDTMLDGVVLCGAPPKNPLSGIFQPPPRRACRNARYTRDRYDRAPKRISLDGSPARKEAFPKGQD